METIQKRLIFVLSTGRCGTSYLCKMLQTIPQVYARHEPPPRFSDITPITNQEQAKRFWAEQKLPEIVRCDKPIYCETSHLFKVFAPALFDLDIYPDLIILERNTRDTALSFWRRLSIPGRTKRGMQFTIHPEGKLDRWQEFTDYQLCYWYCLYTKQLIREIVDLSMRGITHLTTMEEIVTRDGFDRLVRMMGLPSPRWRAYEKRNHWIVNGNPMNYYTVFPKGNLEELEKEVIQAMR